MRNVVFSSTLGNGKWKFFQPQKFHDRNFLLKSRIWFLSEFIKMFAPYNETSANRIPALIDTLLHSYVNCQVFSSVPRQRKHSSYILCAIVQVFTGISSGPISKCLHSLALYFIPNKKGCSLHSHPKQWKLSPDAIALVSISLCAIVDVPSCIIRFVCYFTEVLNTQ